MKKLVSAILTISLLSTSTVALANDYKAVSKNAPKKKIMSTLANGAVKFEVLSNLNTLNPTVKAKLLDTSKTRGFFYMSNTGSNGFIFSIASGVKPNAGYGIKVKSVKYTSGKMQIVVEETLPKSGVMYAEQLSYPTVIFKAPLVSEVVQVQTTKGEKLKFIMPAKSTVKPVTNNDSIIINKIDSTMSAKLFIPEDAYNKDMTLAELTKYFGRDPMPVVPAAFKPDSDKVNLIFKADGSMLFMSPYFYTKDVNDANSPSISIQLNKGSLPPKDCIYNTSPTESVIENTKLVIGLVQMNDSLDTNSATGTYDVYMAQFIYKGIGYDLSAKRVDKQTFITLLKSIIKD